MQVGKYALWPQNQLNHHHALHNHIFTLLCSILLIHKIIMFQITYSKQSTLYPAFHVNVIGFINVVAQKYKGR